MFTVDLAQAITWINRAWSHVSNQAIGNCFLKTGFACDNPVLIDQSDDEFDDMPLSELRRVLSDTTMEDYVDVDSKVCSREVLTDNDILSEVRKKSNVESDNDESDDDTDAAVEHSMPSTDEARESMETIYNYLQGQSDVPDEIFMCVTSLDRFLSKVNKKQ